MSQYTKLFHSILDSTVWQQPPHVKIVWITMLAMVDRHGDVEASVPGLALRAGVERSQCEQALAILMAPDPDSRTKDHDGRRVEEIRGGWHLLNHEYYRQKMSADEKREKAAERQRRRRAKLADNAEAVTLSVTPCHAKSRESHPVTPVTTSDQIRSDADQMGESAPPIIAPGSKSMKDWSRLADVMRIAIQEAAKAERLPHPIECSEPDHKTWIGCAKQALAVAEARSIDPMEVMQLAAREAAADMPRRGWKTRWLVEDFVQLIAKDHISRRAKAREASR